MRALTKTCNFRDIGESLIRDHFVLGLLDHRLTKTLLASGDPNLVKALDVCRSEKMAAAQSRRIIADSQRQLNVDAVHGTLDEELEEQQVDAVRKLFAARSDGSGGDSPLLAVDAVASTSKIVSGIGINGQFVSWT